VEKRKKQIKRKKKSKLQRLSKRIHFHIPYNKIDQHFAFIDTHHLNLEIYFTAETLDSINPGKVINLLQRFTYNPSFTVHGPFMDLSPGAIDPLVREITIKRFLQAINVGDLIGADQIVFHSGYEKWKYDLKTDLWLEGSRRTWQPIVKYADEKGLRIAVENIFEDEPENLRLLMQDINADHFGICFDTGHFNLFSRISLTEWLDIIGPHLLALHIHDNDGSGDHHSAPGEGIFDFTTLFQKLEGLNEKDIILTAEVHSIDDVKKSLNFLSVSL
jgi:sugar phosphate isomerase/epimerase